MQKQTILCKCAVRLVRHSQQLVRGSSSPPSPHPCCFYPQAPPPDTYTEVVLRITDIGDVW